MVSQAGPSGGLTNEIGTGSPVSIAHFARYATDCPKVDRLEPGLLVNIRSSFRSDKRYK